MKRFMYFSVSVLCMAIAAIIGFHIGSSTISAQTASDIQYHTVECGSGKCLVHAITPSGDVYYNYHYDGSEEFCYQTSKHLGIFGFEL